jgi:hypothetical protein
VPKESRWTHLKDTAPADESKLYAIAIGAGRRRPHPKHWEALAGLDEITANTYLLTLICA